MTGGETTLRRQMMGALSAAAVLTGCLATMAPMAASAVVHPASESREWVLSTTDPSKDYAPTFVGNGYLAARVPAAGEGFSTNPITTQSQLAGFYAKPQTSYEVRASLPTWTTLGFGRADGAPDGIYGIGATAGTTSDYRQSLDLRTGVLTTSFDWNSPDGDTTSFEFRVSANRADGHLGTVTALVTPHWSGTAAVVDELDGRGLSHASTTATAVDGPSATTSATVVTDGNAVTAALSSALRVDDKTIPTSAITNAGAGTAGQRATFPVSDGHTYEITKFVGVASSVDTDRSLSETPQQAAARSARDAAAAGLRKVSAANDDAWAGLWRADISIPGDADMTAQVHAAMFYLLASMREGVTWSTSPGGLSSDGYNGHVFWDMETWMYPALLAQHPDIANTANTYRQKLLPAAQSATATLPSLGIAGAKFAWESALTGTESTPPPATSNAEGLQELHINSDIALAQWQYYETTGDVAWLREKAWPVLKAIAEFWAVRATPHPGGGYDIANVQAPDEYQEHVTNDAYTNAGAAKALRIATEAAGIIGQSADPAWKTVADGLPLSIDATLGIHPEYDGYLLTAPTIKQADVTLLQYPLSVPMPEQVAQNDLAYYSARTDPNGPSMTDSIAAIDAAALGSSGCTAFDHLKSSVEPFLAPPFAQFHESRSGGAFTFTTAEGGYLQEFLYGFTGLRWATDAVTIDPFLPTQLPGDDVTGIRWQGRTFDISVRQHGTTVTLRSGAPLPVRDRDGRVHTVTSGHPLDLPTRHPAPTAKPSGCAGPITSAPSKLCADISGGSNADGTALQLYSCNRSVAQIWGRPGDGTVRAMGKCMDVKGGANADGTAIDIYTCNGTASQQWTYDEDTEELRAFGKCLNAGGTSSGTPLTLKTCNGDAAQRWHLPS